MSTEDTIEKKPESDECMICPHCDGYGYQGDGEMPGGHCIACGDSGLVTKSQLEEWEAENSPDKWIEFLKRPYLPQLVRH